MSKDLFDMDMSGLISGLGQLDRKVEFALDSFCERAAQGLEDYAKRNRKWTDRTGNARQRLSGKTFKVAKGRRIELSHGVDYGIWLEMANERKFAIIEPSIEKYGTEQIMPGFEKFMENKI